MSQQHIDRKCFPRFRENKKERKKEEQAIIGSPHVVIREVVFIEEEEKCHKRKEPCAKPRRKCYKARNMQAHHQKCGGRREGSKEILEHCYPRNIPKVNGVII